jgi:selenophosphate synthetase-related protein
MPDVDALAAAVRRSGALNAKRQLRILRDRLPAVGDGDDGALVPSGDGFLVLCGEAIAPALVAADPHAAGAAAVVTNVADVRAMGGRPLGLIDMVVSPDAGHAERVLDGLAWAAELLGVDVVGGHLTLGHPPAVAASCTGLARRPLRASAARPGDVLLAAFALEGRYLGTTDFFSSLRERDAAALRGDGEALVEVAERGLCRAARDISMPGAGGSLLQLLEAAGCGAVLDLDRLARPPDVPAERWLMTFPSFGFLLAADPEAVPDACAVFSGRGLTCAPCGAFDDSRTLRLATGGRTATVWDLAAEPLTGLADG